MGRIKSITMFSILACLSTSLWAGETLRLTTGEWPPYISKDLNYYGPVTRIINEAFEREGIEVIYNFFPWGRALFQAQKPEWDGSAVWGKGAEREELFYYSDYVFKDTVVFFHLKSSKFTWDTMESLKGVKIGGTIKYNYGDAFNAAETAGLITVNWVPKDLLNFKMLLNGRVNIIPQELGVGYKIIEKNFSPDQAKLFTHHSKPVRLITAHLLLSKKKDSNKRMLEIFNRGLKQLKAEGKVDQYLEEGRSGKYQKGQGQINRGNNSKK